MNRLLTFLAVIFLHLFITLPVFAQTTKMLSGIVLNDAKQPISQVTLNIPGSNPVYTEKMVVLIFRVLMKRNGYILLH